MSEEQAQDTAPVAEAPAETAQPVEQPTEPVEKPEEPTTSEAPQKPNRVQQRINELTREKYEARQQAEQMQQQLEELQRQIQQPAGDQPPRLENYGDEDSYYKAVQDWNKSQVEAIQEQQLQQQQLAQQQQAQQQRQLKVHQKIIEAQQKYPDFAMKLNDPTLLPLEQVSQAAYEALIESDDFAGVANYLLSNHDEYYALGNLSPVQAVKRIAQLDVQLAATPSPQSKPITPPTELGGNAPAGKNPADMTPEEFRQWREDSMR